MCAGLSVSDSKKVTLPGREIARIVMLRTIDLTVPRGLQ